MSTPCSMRWWRSARPSTASCDRRPPPPAERRGACPAPLVRLGGSTRLLRRLHGGRDRVVRELLDRGFGRGVRGARLGLVERAAVERREHFDQRIDEERWQPDSDQALAGLLLGGLDELHRPAERLAERRRDLM